MQNDDVDEEDLANDLLPQISYKLKIYSLRDLCKEEVRDEILNEE